MSSSTIHVCDPLRNPQKSILLNAILSYLYHLRNSETRSKTIDEIIDGVQAQDPQFSDGDIHNGVRHGAHQGLFSLVCTTEIPPLGTLFENRYEFNPNAPLVNPKNWIFLCPGARTMTPGTCCYKPCRCKKGSVSQLAFGCSRVGGNQPQTETITIPGVPGTITRVPPLNSCQLII